MSDFNERVIAEFRANRGRVESTGFGDSLILLHTIGAKSGAERVNPVLARRDGDDWLIAASAAGSVSHPAWYLNLRAHPDTTIETGTEIVEVTATDLSGAEYDTAWRGFEAQSSSFASYRERAGGRLIPVVRLTRREKAA